MIGCDVSRFNDLMNSDAGALARYRHPDRYWRWRVEEDEPGREQRG